MMSKPLPLIIALDARLKQPTQDLLNTNQEILQLLQDLFATLKCYDAIGLTAVHIGILQSIIVTNLKEPLVFINPKLIYTSMDCSISEEASVSFPNITIKILRYNKVIVEYFDEKWCKQKIEAVGLMSYCLQRELDQLAGITIVDRILKLERDLLLKKLTKYKNNILKLK